MPSAQIWTKQFLSLFLWMVLGKKVKFEKCLVICFVTVFLSSFIYSRNCPPHVFPPENQVIKTCRIHTEFTRIYWIHARIQRPLEIKFFVKVLLICKVYSWAFDNPLRFLSYTTAIKALRYWNVLFIIFLYCAQTSAHTLVWKQTHTHCHLPLHAWLRYLQPGCTKLNTTTRTSETKPSPPNTKSHFSLVICGLMELKQFIGITVGKRSCGGYCVSLGPLEGGGGDHAHAVVFGKDLFDVEWSQLGIRKGWWQNFIHLQHNFLHLSYESGLPNYPDTKSSYFITPYFWRNVFISKHFRWGNVFSSSKLFLRRAPTKLNYTCASPTTQLMLISAHIHRIIKNSLLQNPAH